MFYLCAYAYPPNLQAVRYLADEILPRLARRGIDAKVLAVGPMPPERSISEHVIFTGPVDDLAPVLLGGPDIAAVTLLDGGGTRMKILEYFAAGLPVVATKKGVEGIPVQHGVHALVSDDPEELAQHLSELVEDPEYRRELAREGAELVSHLDWSGVAERYLEIAQIPFDSTIDEYHKAGLMRIVQASIEGRAAPRGPIPER